MEVQKLKTVKIEEHHWGLVLEFEEEVSEAFFWDLAGMTRGSKFQGNKIWMNAPSNMRKNFTRGSLERKGFALKEVK